MPLFYTTTYAKLIYNPSLKACCAKCIERGLAERFELLVPEPVASPMAQLKRYGKQRQRASVPSPPSGTSGKWQWGERPSPGAASLDPASARNG